MFTSSRAITTSNSVNKYGRWKDQAYQRKFLDQLSKTLNIKEWTDWYEVSGKDFRENGGRGLLSHFKESHIHTLMECYPEYQWKPWKFKHTPTNYWKDEKHQREFMDDAAKRLGILKWEDWYLYNKGTIVDLGGGALFKYYGTLYDTLVRIYPQYSWKKELFGIKETGYWSVPQHQRNFFENLSKLLNIRSLEEWLMVKQSDISKHGGSVILSLHGSLPRALQAIYPEFDWKAQEPSRYAPSKSHARLFHILQAKYPELEVYLNYPHKDVVFPESGKPMEFDIFIPSLNLAFEYQGEVHYKDSKLLGNAIERQKNDQKKKEICEKVGITLVQVPQWWDGTISSLQKIMQEQGFQNK